METTETVQSTIVAEETSAKVRFVRNVNSGKENAKAPRFKAFLYLTGAFSGMVLETPIFKGDDGTFSVGVPGGRFAAIKAANSEITLPDGTEYLLSDPDPIGARKMDGWSGAILTAFHAFQQSEYKKPVQRVVFAG